MFKSVESLIATNNGFFKSQKQADFLTSMLSKEYGNISIGSTYGNGFMITYLFDEKGITKKEQYNYKTSKTIFLWERVVEGKLSIQDEKLLKTLKRRLSKAEKSLKSRISEKANYGNYIDSVDSSFAGDKLQYCEWLKGLNEKGILSDMSDIEFLQSKIKELTV